MTGLVNITRPASRVLRGVCLIAVVIGLAGWSTGSAHSSGRGIAPLSTPDGVLGSFSALGTGSSEAGWNTVWSIARWGNDRIVVGGEFEQMGGVTGTAAIAVWNGNQWSALGSGFHPGKVYSVAALDSDKLVAAVYSNIENAPDHVYEWNGSGWINRVTVEEGGFGEGDVVPWTNSTIAFSGSFACITSSECGDVPPVGVEGIALLSGNTVSALGLGERYFARKYSLARWSDDKLVVGGDFDQLGGVPGTKKVAAWNGSAWSALGGGTNDSVRAIARKDDDSLIVGGLFTSALNADGSSVSDTARIAEWSNATGSWKPLGSGLCCEWPDLVRAIAVDSERDLIYAGGRFQKYVGGNDNSLNSVGVWDEGVREWIPLQYSPTENGIDRYVVQQDVMAIHVDGAKVYLGGDFRNAGGVANADRIAMWTWDAPEGSNNISSLPATLSGEGFIGVPATGGVKFGNVSATYTRVNSTTITVTSLAGSEWSGSSIAVDGVGGWGTVGTCEPPLCPNAPAVTPDPDVIQSLPTLPESTPLARATGTTMSPGESITVTYGGFAPSEAVHLWVNSTPQLIGSGDADSTGSVTITGSIPPGLTAGSHSLVLHAPRSGRGARQAISVVPVPPPATAAEPTLPTNAAEVTPPARAAQVKLAATGVDVTLASLALLLLVAGTISRRLRRNT